ncbi:protein PFC0760c-like [Lytechinus pictus]|uniref:protein PFC0760c-like n=1 Tax=Lytechinus pictus TaxID=7653 RepID=UPI0030B9DFA9
MRPVMILPSLNTMDKPGVQAASTSDVRKLANRCWSTNPQTKTLSEPVQRSGQQGSRPTSIRSLPILPSQKTFNHHVTVPPRTPNQDRQSQRGLRDSHMEPFPAIQSQCRTASRQSSLSLPRSDVSRGSKRKRRKPLKRYREVFVWDHRTRTCSEPGMKIANGTLPSVGTENPLMLATDNQARTLYTPTGQARQKRKQRAQGLLGMLERPLKLDQLCKTPVPNTAWTSESTDDSPFPSKTIVLPPIGQYNEEPGGEEGLKGLSQKNMTEQMHKKSVKKMDKGIKSLKSRKKMGKEKLKLKDVEVQHQGTGNGSEHDSDGYTQEDLEDTSGSDSDHDGDDGNSDMGWTDDDYDDDDESGGFLIASRINSQMRKSACSTSQFSRASGFTMNSVEIKRSGDNSDEYDGENDEDDDENSNDGADDNEDSIDGSQVENNSTDQDDDDDDNEDDDEDEEMEDNNSKDDNSSDAAQEDDDLLSHMDIEDIDNDTIKDSDDEEDEDMFVRVSDYGDSEDEIEEENTTAAGDTATENFESEMEGDDNEGDDISDDDDDDDNDDDNNDNVDDK